MDAGCHVSAPSVFYHAYKSPFFFLFLSRFEEGIMVCVNELVVEACHANLLNHRGLRFPGSF